MQQSTKTLKPPSGQIHFSNYRSETAAWTMSWITLATLAAALWKLKFYLEKEDSFSLKQWVTPPFLKSTILIKGHITILTARGQNSPDQWSPALPPTAGSCGRPGWRGQWPSPPCPGSGERQWRGEGEQPGAGGPRCWTRSSRRSCRGSGWRRRDKTHCLPKQLECAANYFRILAFRNIIERDIVCGERGIF